MVPPSSKSRGYNATLPARLQVENIILTMSRVQDGHDIRTWSATARKELVVGDVVDLVNQNGGIIASAPKLALVVASSDFRGFFTNTPNTKIVNIDPSVDEASVRVLIAWLKSLVETNSKAGVSLPTLATDIIKVRHAAHALGMELYVRHFCKAYKDDLRKRTPLIPECDLVERCAIGAVDDMVTGLGERLAYLRRRGDFNAKDIARLAEYLQVHPALTQAIWDADVRAAKTRYA